METLYGDENLLQTLLVTLVIGGGAAWLAGQAVARTWRPLWQMLLYMLLLGAGIRFIHFALFDATLLSAAGYAIDTSVAMLLGCFSWRLTRASQMVTQYAWLYERNGLLSWRERPAADHDR
ncbi:MAG TPA: hypothetical protein VG985_04095 [Xanthobacteraceae bacterium]|nr:hypothetical protein [Xanthobacteraceae bacterium]